MPMKYAGKVLKNWHLCTITHKKETAVLNKVATRINNMALVGAYGAWHAMVTEAKVITRMNDAAINSAFDAWWEFRCMIKRTEAMINRNDVRLSAVFLLFLLLFLC